MATRREREVREARETSARSWAEKQDRRYEPTDVALPEGKQWFRPKANGIYKLDFFKYKVGKGNPMADEGMRHFERQFSVHRVPTPSGRSDSYCCLKECFGKRCPVCEWMIANSDNEKMCEQLRPQQRHLWNVLDVTSSDSRKIGIQVWNNTFGGKKHPSFGYMLKNKIKAVERYENFANLKGGYTIFVTMEEDSFPGGGKFMRVVDINLEKRDQDYDKSILEGCVCLDECLINPGYEKLQEALLMKPAQESNGRAEDEDEDDRPKARAKSEEEDDEYEDEEEEEEDIDEEDLDDEDGDGEDEDGEDEDGEDEDEEEDEGSDEDPSASDLGIVTGSKVEYDGEECEVTKVSGDGTSLTLKDGDGVIYRAIAPSQCKVLGGKDDEDDDDDEDEDLEEDEDEEVRPEIKAPAKSKPAPKASKKPEKKSVKKKGK